MTGPIRDKEEKEERTSRYATESRSESVIVPRREILANGVKAPR